MTIETVNLADRPELEVRVRFGLDEFTRGPEFGALVVERVAEAIAEKIEPRVLEAMNVDGKDPSRSQLAYTVRQLLEDRLARRGEQQFLQEVMGKIDVQALTNSVFINLIARLGEKPTKNY